MPSGSVTPTAVSPPFSGGTITSPLEIDSNSQPQLKIYDATGTTLLAEIDASTTRMDFYRDPNNNSAPAIQMRTTGMSLKDELFSTLVLLQTGVLSLGANGQMALRGSAAAFGHAVPANADLNAGEVALYLDQTDGAAKLMVKGKSANGTVVAAAIALS